MKIIIDRFEGNVAVVELLNGTTIDCPIALLPDNACEGSIVNITVDEKATEEKLHSLTDRMNRLFKE